MRVLVAADRLAAGPVDVPELVEPAAHQNGVHRRGWHRELGADLDLSLLRLWLVLKRGN